MSPDSFPTEAKAGSRLGGAESVSWFSSVPSPPGSFSLPSLEILSRTPFTKAPESSEPNFLPISTASLIVTLEGISSTKISSKTAIRRMFRSTDVMRSMDQCSEYREMASSICPRFMCTPKTRESANCRTSRVQVRVSQNRRAEADGVFSDTSMA